MLNLKHSVRGNEVNCRTLIPDPSWILGLTYYAKRLHYIHVFLPMKSRSTLSTNILCEFQDYDLSYEAM